LFDFKPRFFGFQDNHEVIETEVLELHSSVLPFWYQNEPGSTKHARKMEDHQVTTVFRKQDLKDFSTVRF
jgi:hypothetical protein